MRWDTLIGNLYRTMNKLLLVMHGKKTKRFQSNIYTLSRIENYFTLTKTPFFIIAFAHFFRFSCYSSIEVVVSAYTFYSFSCPMQM